MYIFTRAEKKTFHTNTTPQPCSVQIFYIVSDTEQKHIKILYMYRVFVFTNVIYINLFTFWRVTMTAKLFPHILSLVIAVKRGSGLAALSLLKL